MQNAPTSLEENNLEENNLFFSKLHNYKIVVNLRDFVRVVWFLLHVLDTIITYPNSYSSLKSKNVLIVVLICFGIRYHRILSCLGRVSQ